MNKIVVLVIAVCFLVAITTSFLMIGKKKVNKRLFLDSKISGELRLVLNTYPEDMISGDYLSEAKNLSGD